MTIAPSEALPPIVVSDEDYATLSALADSYAQSMPDVTDYLVRELDRAAVVAPDAVPAGVATMHSTMRFRDDVTRKERTVTLVYPGEQDIAEGRISVMTPIGVALIGLRKDQSIAWETRRGEAKGLTILDVT